MRAEILDLMKKIAEGEKEVDDFNKSILTDEELTEIAENGDGIQRILVAGYPQLPEKLILELAGGVGMEVEVRREVAKRKDQLSFKVQKILSEDWQKTVRTELALREDLFPKITLKLARDPVEVVRMTLLHVNKKINMPWELRIFGGGNADSRDSDNLELFKEAKEKGIYWGKKRYLFQEPSKEFDRVGGVLEEMIIWKGSSAEEAVFSGRIKGRAANILGSIKLPKSFDGFFKSYFRERSESKKDKKPNMEIFAQGFSRAEGEEIIWGCFGKEDRKKFINAVSQVDFKTDYNSGVPGSKKKKITGYLKGIAVVDNGLFALWKDENGKNLGWTTEVNAARVPKSKKIGQDNFWLGVNKDSLTKLEKLVRAEVDKEIKL